jgi:pyruvate dehydrogenase E2 component (dihydrolipoamide acetyltransferase)
MSSDFSELSLIPSPQSCILAVGTAEKRLIPGLEKGKFDVGSYITVTLSCDHRVVDGALGAAWLGAFKGYIEDPVTLLL